VNVDELLAQRATVAEFAAALDFPEQVLADFLAESDEQPDEDGRFPVVVLSDAVGSIQTDLLDELVAAHENVQAHSDYLRQAKHDLQRLVRESLTGGLSAADVSGALGVSRARVYQMRDGKR
jgi:hypothetical protein